MGLVDPNTPITVVGAGVVGLTTALALAKAGRTVGVLSRDEPAATTSYVAGAVWEPYLSAGGAVLDWAADSLGWLRKLSTVPGTGVELITSRQVSRTPIRQRPDWTQLVDVQPAAELPPGFVDGYQAEIPTVDMPTHLRWLGERCASYGITIEHAELSTLSEVSGPLINCTGLGAAGLVGDASVRAVRGDVLWVRNPGLTVALLDHDEADPTRPTYLLPHGEWLVLGGTALEGVEDLEPDPATEADIRRRCAALDPRVADAELIAHRVGLRPVRPSVRVQREQVDGRVVVHNYGHGGSGVTLAWGCAREVVHLLGAKIVGRINA